MHIQTLLKEIHAETFRFILFTVYDTMYLQALNKNKQNKKYIFVQLITLIFILIYIVCVLASSSLFQVYMYVVLDITCI